MTIENQSPTNVSEASIRELSAQSGPSAVSRESLMVVIERNDEGTPTVWCDPEIVDLVTALNKGGIRTVASCSGHGVYNGNVALADGRELIIALNFEEARAMEKKLLNTSPAEPSDRAIADMVEGIAKVLSGAPLPSVRSYTKAREVMDFVLIQTPPAGARDAVTKVGYVFEMKDQDGRPELRVSWEDDIPPEGTELFTLTGKADGGEVRTWPKECDNGCPSYQVCDYRCERRPKATQPAASYKLTDDDLEIV